MITSLRFRVTAQNDLEMIDAYYRDISDATLARVMKDISNTLETIKLFPKAGTPLGPTPHRRLVTPKYRFVIVYVDQDTFVDVVGIFRFQDRSYDET